MRRKTSILLALILLLLVTLLYGCESENAPDVSQGDIGGFGVNEDIDKNRPALEQNIPQELIGTWEITDENGSYGYEFRSDGTAIFRQDNIELPCIFECAPQADGTIKLFLDVKHDEENTEYIITFFRIDGDVLSIIVDGVVQSTMNRVK